ncbi:hypothetical protein VNO80_25047 [Phaseolus coccineus]|uniref:Uncharacterized protein n=1 Tax=Phaseolus coccineus TaxID=3886 RepID=A0AAN9LU05_PHACN
MVLMARGERIRRVEFGDGEVLYELHKLSYSNTQIIKIKLTKEDPFSAREIGTIGYSSEILNVGDVHASYVKQ